MQQRRSKAVQTTLWTDVTLLKGSRLKNFTFVAYDTAAPDTFPLPRGWTKRTQSPQRPRWTRTGKTLGSLPPSTTCLSNRLLVGAAVTIVQSGLALLRATRSSAVAVLT